nr:hypothetical protein [Deltaproteobacteria bacterium]
MNRRRSVGGLFALLVLGALGCRQRPPPPTAAPIADVAVDAGAPALVAARDATAGAPGGRLMDLAGETAVTMARIRGLSLQHEVRRGVMDRDAIVSRLREKTAREYPPGEILLEGELYKRLGLLPEAMDYERTMFDLLEEQVAGFYDPDEQTLYIAGWLPSAAQPVTMAHEITHALQDQHFQIGRYTHHVRGRGDAQTAAMAVIEGDATASMLDFMLAPMGRRTRDMPDVTAMVASQLQGADQMRLREAPRALRESLLFPYLAGLGMCVRALRAGEGYSRVDALLATPPQSTEQVLHEAKLAAREAPVMVPSRVPPALAGEYEVAYHDVMGELGSRLFFYSAMPDARAHSAAQGWGGDHAVLLVPRGTMTSAGDAGVNLAGDALTRDVMLWTVVLDPVEGARGAAADREAVDFAEAAVSVLMWRHGARPAAAVAGAMAARDVGGGRVSLVARSGRRVLVADRVPRASAAAVVRSALAE